MSQSEDFEEIRTIADAVCDENVSREQMSRLESLLSTDETRKFYLDYVGMHARLKSESGPAIEVIMRRLQVEELIVRPAGSGGAGQPPNENFDAVGEPKRINGSVNRKKHYLLYLTVIPVLLILAFLIGRDKGLESNKKIATVISGSVSSKYHGIMKGDLSQDTYISKEETVISLNAGNQIKFAAGSKFELKANNEIILQTGIISQESPAGENLKILTKVYTLESNRSSFKIDLINARIITDDSSVILKPAVWKPRHYWNFDESDDRVLDLVGNAHGIPGDSLIKSTGLLGKNAYTFNNLKTDFIDVGSGGGTALATGSFSVTDGVTVEALFKTNWTGDKMDYDEIFRKDQDGNLRMLLSFQNDLPKNSDTAIPKVESGPTLSFGLYLVGQGYHELEMPLDGKDGRPTLEQLKNEKKTHVVACYNTKSGKKCLYLNGKLMVSHQYPPGTKMLSGGPGKATIGNSPNGYNEAFNGIIDEVAFYDFSLSPFMVNYHINMINGEKSYFGADFIQKIPEEITIELPGKSIFVISPETGLPE